MSKELYIVSTGRCGTKRLSEILSKYCSDDYVVTHQVKYSRISNVTGNLMLLLGNNEYLKNRLINLILPKTNKNYITTDPLVSLVIPSSKIMSNNVAILHVVRDPMKFGKSFYQFTRKRIFSYIAHNFIPFWQPKVYPLENLFKGEKMIAKYAKVANYKEKVFEVLYSRNLHYEKIQMIDIFEGEKILSYINKFFNDNIDVPQKEFQTKSNQSK